MMRVLELVVLMGSKEEICSLRRLIGRAHNQKLGGVLSTCKEPMMEFTAENICDSSLCRLECGGEMNR